MMNSAEPIQKMDTSDNKSIDQTRSLGEEILELAKRSKESTLESTLSLFETFEYGRRKSDKRDGKDGSEWSIESTIAIMLQISYLIIVMVYIGPMLVDPLFLYVPIINENIKCLALDEKLKKTAIVLRSIIDVPYLYNTILHVLSVLQALRSTDRNSYWWREAGRLFHPEFLLHNILPVLPIPQIVILIFLPKMRGSRSLNGMKFLNLLILLQYVARACPIFTFCKNYNKSTRELSNNIAMRKKIWIPGLLNFIMYILASHVLGAFWYFFSIQREIDCWISTCRSENECDLSTLQCDNTTFRNITLLHDLCPTNPPNPVVFDFGIFLNTLQSGIIVGTTDFPQKFLMCFSWGLRNLSSFASNLNTSTYAWETVFVIFISMSGLVLFIYLLGHLQTFMQATTRTYRIRLRKKVIFQQIRFMLSEYRIPDNLPNPDSREPVAEAIWELVREALEKDEDLPVKNIFSLLPNELKEHIKNHLFLAKLKKVRGLENKDGEVLKKIMGYLEPVNYADGSYIIREGEPLDRMLFITQGSVLTYKTTIGGGSGSSSIIRRDFYGEELIGWAKAYNSLSDFPISAKTVKSRTEVEVFVLMADHLQFVVSEFRTQSNREIPQPADSAPVQISIS